MFKTKIERREVVAAVGLVLVIVVLFGGIAAMLWAYLSTSFPP